MGTDGEIPPHSTTYMETACSYNEPVVMHPFAYRTHAHTHGAYVRVVSTACINSVGIDHS